MEIFQILFLILSCSLLAYILGISRPSRLPPGPIPLPIIGNMVQLYIADRQYTFKAITKFAKKYGDVLWLRVGSANIVALNGFSAIKAALCDTDDFLNRPEGEWILDRSFGKPQGLISSRDEFWSLTKSFTLRHLKHFGYGSKLAMQGFVNDELEVILGDIDRAVQKNAVGGVRFSHEDPRIQELLRLNTALVKNIRATGGILTLFPWLGKLFPWVFNCDKLIAVNRATQAFLKVKYKEITLYNFGV